MQTRLPFSRFWLCLTLLGCADSDADGAGTVHVSLTGQEFAKTGWPAMDGDDVVAFDDGWEVRFEHVIVAAEAFRLREGASDITAREPAGYLVDVQKGTFDVWELPDVPAQRFRDVGYRFAPPKSEAVVLGDVPEAIQSEMTSGGLSLWIEGTGKKDGRTVTFAFGIPGAVTMSNCLNGLDETDGMIVGAGRTSEVELTLHMDHLFWDDHDAEEPRLLFGPIAYAAGEDDHVTLDELATQRLTDLYGEDGAPLVDAEGLPIVYVPRVELSDNNLRAYMVDTALTLGHFNGEGHCAYEIGD